MSGKNRYRQSKREREKKKKKKKREKEREREREVYLGHLSLFELMGVQLLLVRVCYRIQ